MSTTLTKENAAPSSGLSDAEYLTALRAMGSINLTDYANVLLRIAKMTGKCHEDALRCYLGLQTKGTMEDIC